MKKILIMLITVTTLNSCVSGPNRRISTRLFGKGMKIGELIYHYDSERSFHGDGYSVEFYNIAEEENEYISTNIELIKNNYPKKNYYRKEWDLETWTKTPINKNKELIISFTSSSCDGSENGIRSGNYIKMLLEEEGNYYSHLSRINEYNSKTYISDIDLYIYSPKRRILVLINHNT